MRKNPIERAEKFHLGKRRQTWEGPAHKKQLYTVIFFRALSLTLPFHYLCSSTKLRYCIYLPYLLCHYIAIVHIRPERKRERESSTLPTFFFFSDNPLVVVGLKRGVHGCQIALKTPWKIDLQHFSGPWHYWEGSWIGNLWARDGIKMSSLLEKKEKLPI